MDFSLAVEPAAKAEGWSLPWDPRSTKGAMEEADFIVIIIFLQDIPAVLMAPSRGRAERQRPQRQTQPFSSTESSLGFTGVKNSPNYQITG